MMEPQPVLPGKGYSNGMVFEVVARAPDLKPRVLHVAGQIGGELQSDGRHKIITRDFLAQFDAALEQLVKVLQAAGAEPRHVAEMTVYVTDMAAYRNARAKLGPVWKRHMGSHFPAMTLVGVRELFEPDAAVEIKATAYVG